MGGGYRSSPLRILLSLFPFAHPRPYLSGSAGVPFPFQPALPLNLFLVEPHLGLQTLAQLLTKAQVRTAGFRQRGLAWGGTPASEGPGEAGGRAPETWGPEGGRGAAAELGGANAGTASPGFFPRRSAEDRGVGSRSAWKARGARGQGHVRPAAWGALADARIGWRLR